MTSSKILAGAESLVPSPLLATSALTSAATQGGVGLIGGGGRGVSVALEVAAVVIYMHPSSWEEESTLHT